MDSDYHRNQQYSIYAMTNSSGSVVERYAYTAYGQPTVLNASASVIATSAYDNRYTYTAREWDHTVGMYYFRAKWVSGNSGRFTSLDPAGYADGMSLYACNVVLSSTDPDGEKALKNCKTWQTSLGIGVKDWGENTKMPGLSERLRKLLNFAGLPTVQWNAWGGLVYKCEECDEDCGCYSSASFAKAELSGRGGFSLGITAPTIPITPPLTFSGEIRINFDVKSGSFAGGCSNQSSYFLCGAIKGGGQIKVCTGVGKLIEACVIVKVECDVVGACKQERSSPTRGGCKLSLTGSACIGHGLLCGEITRLDTDFDLPFIH